MRQSPIFVFIFCLVLVGHGRPTDHFELSTIEPTTSNVPTKSTPPMKLTNQTENGLTTKPATITATTTEKTQSHGKLTVKENRKLQKQCGYYPGSKTKSVNSESSVRKQAPWVVGLAYAISENSSNTQQICSGTLISNRHVLTAWHCLSGVRQSKIQREKEVGNVWVPKKEYVVDMLVEESEIILEKNRFVFDDDCSASQTLANCSIENATIRKTVRAVSPKIFIKHLLPGDSDVVVFELDEPIEFGPDLYPACLSETSPNVSDVFDLYSYGLDRRPEHTLTGSLQHVLLRATVCHFEASIDTICIENGYESTDQGDSGGGLTYKKDGRAYLTGAVSGAIGRNPKYIRDVAIAPHLSWICKHVGVCADLTKAKQLHPQIETITIS